MEAPTHSPAPGTRPQQGSGTSDVLVLKWDTSSALQRELLTLINPQSFTLP